MRLDCCTKRTVLQKKNGGIELFTIETLIATIAAVVAGFSRGFTGFGSSLIMAPVYALIYGPVVTVATVLLLEVAVSVDSFTRVFKIIPWRIMIPMWIMAWLAIISDTTSPAPHFLTIRRKGRSLTPDMGASTTGSSIRTGPTAMVII